MEQQIQLSREHRIPGPSGLDDPFSAGAEQFGGMADVNGESVPVAGMTLSEIRDRLADRFRIEAGSSTVVNGEIVDDLQRVVRPGEHVEFIRRAGEKGTRRTLPSS